MEDQRERARARIDGRASFAAAAYLTGVGLIYLLGRVGAPDGLVQALGPLFALSAIALLGVLTRSTRVPTFFIADRAIPAVYGGMAFSAFAAGLFLCLGPAGGAPLPLAGVAVGLGIGALLIGPMLRASGASAVSDLLATRFPNFLLKAIFTGLLLAVGIFIAAAGFEAATEAFIALFAASRGAAAAVIAATLVLMIAPGGLAGLLWGAAASAGILLIISILPIAAQFFTDDASFRTALRDAGLWRDALTQTLGASASDSGPNIAVILASALAVSALPPFTSPAIAAFGERQALRAGALGLVFVALIGTSAFIDLVVWPSPAGPMSSGLKASALLLAGLALCSAGVHSASRARGANAGRAYGRYMPLASQRLARSRALALGIIALCAALIYRLAFDPKAAVVVASALSLSLVAPVLGLAFSSRATAVHAILCIFVSLATVVVLGLLERRIPNADRLLIGALCAGAAGFATGWGAAIFVRGDNEENPVRRDLFIDAPLDPGN
jgi:cation/acetate symporter